MADGQHASATPSDVIPNFDAQGPIPREAHDPEFLLHCCGYGNAATASPCLYTSSQGHCLQGHGWTLEDIVYQLVAFAVEGSAGERGDKEAHPDRGYIAIRADEGRHGSPGLPALRVPFVAQSVCSGGELSQHRDQRSVDG